MVELNKEEFSEYEKEMEKKFKLKNDTILFGLNLMKEMGIKEATLVERCFMLSDKLGDIAINERILFNDRKRKVVEEFLSSMESSLDVFIKKCEEAD